ncbi:MAG: PAS domain S-box protein [Deltaproteobacteria bacterium]|nr:PAS domain S-box protein [Deltaproteobacteria bacterium]
MIRGRPIYQDRSDTLMPNLQPTEISPLILQNMLDNLPVGLMVIHVNGETLTVNQAASKILGYPLNAFDGERWEALLVDREKNDAFNRIIVDIVREKKVNLKRNVWYTRPDGKTLHLSVTGSFLREGENIEGIAVLINDLTELHRAHENEKAVLQENSELQHERAESIRHLAEAVAHQIRNPVAAIGGFSMRLLHKLDPNDPNRKYLETILDGSKRLEDIVRAVGSYTRLLRISPQRVSVLAVLERAQAEIAPKEAELSRKIAWTVQSEPEEMILDPELFCHALKELFLNALEFCNDHCIAISVAIRKNEDHMDVEIRDTGSGISEKDRPYIFDPFFTTKAVGVGMGLCRVKRIISDHKGRIRVDSVPGKGTSVTLRLPESSGIQHKASNS